MARTLLSGENEMLEGFITEATEALRVLPESEERTYLEKLAHYAGSRKK